MISHSELVAGLWLVTTGGALAAGLLIGRARPPAKRLAAEFRAGRGDAISEACSRVERGRVLRLTPEGVAGWCDAGSRWDFEGVMDAADFCGTCGEIACREHGPGYYPDGRAYPTDPRIVNAELAALADPPGDAENDSPGLAPSPYAAGALTPAQRRRDKHKRRGAYAEGELPEPPADLGAWWAGELASLLRDGQSEWFSERMAEL